MAEATLCEEKLLWVAPFRKVAKWGLRSGVVIV